LFSPGWWILVGRRGLQSAGATEGLERKTSGLLAASEHRPRVKLVTPPAGS
jgi:hypothetical protein